MSGGYKATASEDIDLELDLSIMGFNEEFFSCDGMYICIYIYIYMYA
jgi:hypothetical protein